MDGDLIAGRSSADEKTWPLVEDKVFHQRAPLTLHGHRASDRATHNRVDAALAAAVDRDIAPYRRGSSEKRERTVADEMTKTTSGTPIAAGKVEGTNVSIRKAASSARSTT